MADTSRFAPEPVQGRVLDGSRHVWAMDAPRDWAAAVSGIGPPVVCLHGGPGL